LRFSYVKVNNIIVKNLTTTTFKTLFKSGLERDYPKGQIILYEGDAPAQIYLVLKGAIKVYDIDDEGREKVVRLAGEKDLIPMLPVFSKDSTVQSFHSTLSETKLLSVPTDDFLAGLENNSSLAMHCIGWFANHVKELSELLSSMSKTDSRAKIVAILSLLVKKFSKPKVGRWRKISFTVNQQLVADMAGVTRESTNAVFQDLQKAKVIRTPKNGELHINPAKLKELNQ
jgi:CRP/FNR family transcriptional regulator, cyclic AMP receptor protein